jgi:hypothetical protein
MNGPTSAFATTYVVLSLLSLAILLAAGPAGAQQADARAGGGTAVERISGRESVIHALSTVPSPDGGQVTVTNRYVQLEDGLNHWDSRLGAWAESRAELVLKDDGAEGHTTQQKVRFSPVVNDPDGTLTLWTDDKTRLRATVLGLTYFDAASGRQVVLAGVKDAGGEFLPPNQVIYRDAFEGLHADVVYTYRKSGVEQDVVLREAPADPEDFGLLAEATQLEVMTEVFESPEPAARARVIASAKDPAVRAAMAEPDLVDHDLDFGTFQMGQGKAFGDGAARRQLDDPDVAKRWHKAPDGRTALIEAVQYWEVLPLLEKLPVPQGVERRQRAALDRAQRERLVAAALPKVQRGPGREILLARVAGQAAGVAMKRAAAGAPRPGLVIDFETISANKTDFTFKGDTTYWITNSFTLAGTTRLEGGAVIKYDPYIVNTNQPRLYVTGPFICQTSPYRPAIFTARDDNTVGQTVSGSTGSPSGDYALHGLWFQTDSSPVLLEHVRFRYAHHAVLFNNRAGTVRHAQFVQCRHPLYGHTAGTLTVHNVLLAEMRETGSAFKLWSGTALTAEHVTIAGSAYLLGTVDATVSMTLRNSLLAGVTNIQAYVGRNDANYGNAEVATTNGVFQGTGGGGYYLAAGSAHRNAGVTGIDGKLARELGRLTTHPPVVLTNAVTANTALAPVVPRDADLPDRGYHYQPLDYILKQVPATATVRLLDGVAVAVAGGYGLDLQNGGKLVSEGRAEAMNRLVRWHSVQEQAAAEGNGGSFARITGAYAARPEVSLHFTDVAAPANSGNNLLDTGSLQPFAAIRLEDCQLANVGLTSLWPVDSSSETILLRNNLIERGYFGLKKSYYSQNTPLSVSLYNNLFRGGTLDLLYDSGTSNPTWYVRDNLFDGCAATLGGTAVGYVTRSHNGFTIGTGTGLGGASNKTGLTPDYQAGPLGRFYYPSSGTGLASLVDQGSRTADLAGLYHATVLASQLRETNSTVDIGYHYPAVGPVAAGLVGYWSLNDGAGTQATDSAKIGTPNHGTLVGGPAWTAGASAGALNFDGTDDKVTVPDAAALRLTTGMTIAFWYRKSAEAGNWTRLVGKGEGNSRNYGVWEHPGSADGRILFQYFKAGPLNQSVPSTTHLALNRWYHVACTWDGTTGRIYLDGVENGAGAMSGAPLASADPLVFGSYGGTPNMPGALDEVAIYNRALSAAEVAALMSATAPVDTDGDGLADYVEDSNGDGAQNALDGTGDRDGDGIIDRQDARPFDPALGAILPVIETPPGGATLP